MSAKPELNLSLDLIKDNVPANVAPGIWLGSLHAALNQDALQERGITHVANLSGLPATFPKHFSYLTIEVNDNKASDILTCIPATNIFIESALESGGNVLVHCYGGRSRSPAVIIAYLMSTHGYSYDRAVAQVKGARSVVALNTGFEMQLRAYGASGCDVYNAHQLMLQSRLLTISRAKRRRSIVDVDSSNPMASIFNEPVDEALRKSEAPVSIPKLCMPIRQVAMLRLSRPGMKAVQVIPPLQGLELDFKCKSCSMVLFQASSILRHMPGKSPIVSRDLSWMVPESDGASDDEEAVEVEGDEFVAAGDNALDVLAANGLTNTSSGSKAPFSGGLVTSASRGDDGDGFDGFGSFGAPIGVSMSRGMPLTTPRASQAKLAQKSKSFAVPRSTSSLTGGFDSFGVPPTPSNRRGRGGVAPSKQPKIAFASPIHESTVEEEAEPDDSPADEDDEDDLDDGGAVEVVDEGDCFDKAIGASFPSFGAPVFGGSSSSGGLSLSLGSAPSLSFGDAGSEPSSSSFGGSSGFGGLSLGMPPVVGAVPPSLEVSGSSATPFGTTPAVPSLLTTPIVTPTAAASVFAPSADVFLSTTTAPATQAGPSASPLSEASAPLCDNFSARALSTAGMSTPSDGQLSARGGGSGMMSAEKTRFLEKMRWLEEAGLEPGARRTDEEVAQVSGGSGSAALTRRGLRKIRSSTAMQVADADAAAATLHCECVFVEPLSWMGELHGKSGVLKCPGCTKQLGFFNWAGAACSCKAVVQPGFCIQTSNILREQPTVRGKPQRE